ncbi:hypothetical protein BG006_007126 [Podila minutissima]|uniref:Uncharacterized protein n=1 Tax=Podila minutissima TaxID=64525 RepID=A0A9P5SHL7_9FUNG|nr:hypothetical protein BG006_007126 [Podila minutissima]
MSELKSSPRSTPQDRQKMLGILDRFEKQAIAQEELLNSPGNPNLATATDMDMDSHHLGETPGARKTLSAKERNEILRKAIEEEKHEASGHGDSKPEELNDAEKAELEQILEEEHQDLVNRFAGVDLDKESFDTLWAKLTPEEQQEFQEKFMLTGREFGDEDLDLEGSEDVSEEETDQEDRKERHEAKELLREMNETMKRGEMYSETKKKANARTSDDNNNPLLANLDTEDLRAIRDAEISELIPVWRPWWEVEAEEAGQLKKVVVTEVPGDQETEASKAVSSILDSKAQSTPCKELQSSAILTSTHTVLESYVLDEEAMLRPHRSLVQDMEDVKEEQDESLVLMVKEPHPSLIYHVVGLLFAYVATIRVFNGDLKEEPEQVLAYIFDLCPFFAPPPPPSSGSQSNTSKTQLSTPAPVVDVQDFETALAVIQRSSLDSKLWKGDTSRLEMLALLLRDLTLILAKPSRCLFSIRELKQVLNACTEPKTSQAQGSRVQRRLFSKTVLHRLLKKLEFYESFLLCNKTIQQSDRLDRVRTEVVLSGIQVRQEMVGWTKELESVTRVTDSTTQQPSSSSSSKRVLIEEIS